MSRINMKVLCAKLGGGKKGRHGVHIQAVCFVNNVDQKYYHLRLSSSTFCILFVLTSTSLKSSYLPTFPLSLRLSPLSCHPPPSTTQAIVLLLLWGHPLIGWAKLIKILFLPITIIVGQVNWLFAELPSLYTCQTSNSSTAQMQLKLITWQI